MTSLSYCELSKDFMEPVQFNLGFAQLFFWLKLTCGPFWIVYHLIQGEIVTYQIEPIAVFIEFFLFIPGETPPPFLISMYGLEICNHKVWLWAWGSYEAVWEAE